MPHVVTGNCEGCRFTDCVESCPVACFHADQQRVYIDPEVCTDCGACIPACPVHACVEDFDLKPDEEHWLAFNATGARAHPVLRSRLEPLPGADERRRRLGF